MKENNTIVFWRCLVYMEGFFTNVSFQYNYSMIQKIKNISKYYTWKMFSPILKFIWFYCFCNNLLHLLFNFRGKFDNLVGSRKKSNTNSSTKITNGNLNIYAYL